MKNRNKHCKETSCSSFLQFRQFLAQVWYIFIKPKSMKAKMTMAKSELRAQKIISFYTFWPYLQPPKTFSFSQKRHCLKKTPNFLLLAHKLVFILSILCLLFVCNVLYCNFCIFHALLAIQIMIDKTHDWALTILSFRLGVAAINYTSSNTSSRACVYLYMKSKQWMAVYVEFKRKGFYLTLSLYDQFKP